MTLKEIKKLIEKGETQNLEFTRDTIEVGKSICSFANSNNGIILIGVSDDGEIVGCSAKDEQKIANTAHTCKPSIYPKIEKADVDGKLVFVVKVEKSDQIHSYKNIAYKRVGTHDKPLSPEEVIEFAKDIGKIQFDSQICEKASLGDINWEKMRWFKSLYRSITGEGILTEDKKLLENLGCLKNEVVRNSGVLLFGKSPHRFIPHNRITVIRYLGDEISDRYQDIKEFYGNLFDLIDDTDRYIREHIQIASILIPGQIPREEIPQYPLFAIRELIVNAVAHRDYSIRGGRIIIKMFKNRIEYSSPGKFPPGITPENIVDMQYSRNPTIVDVLNTVKYIEAIGDGIDRVLNSVNNHPLKPKSPLFREVGNSVIVTLYGADMNKLERIELERKLNEREIQIVDYIKEKGKITGSNVQSMFNVSRDTSNRYLNRLIKMSIIKRKGRGRATYYALK